MRVSFGLVLPRDEASVPVVRHLIASSLRRLGALEASVQDIQIAVTEACTNVLQHATGTEEEYEVEFSTEGEHCSIRVCDKGRGFDRDAVASADASAESGRGIHLMQAVVDELRFDSRPEEGTMVVLEKQLGLEAGSVLKTLATRRRPERTSV